MLFFDCTTAPNPRRVRMIIAEKRLEIETRELSIANGEQLSPDFLAINPRGTLPVLVTEAGQALSETVAIASYLEDLHPEPSLMGQGAEEKAAVLNWNAVIEQQGGQAIFDAFRNSHPAMKGRAIPGPADYAQIPDLAERSRQRVNAFFELLEARLQQSPFIATNRFTLADISCFVMVEFARVIKMRIPQGNPATLAWYEHICERPSASV
ncbi:glutathione S-transferase [Pontibaca sp. S1109L]|uniref:Glutathione S-transferase n=2 Tax=Pontibaca salina TaxID=2795731 RepID=A0A934HSQ6_9RHOB|nr:glutathione S-transferase [Pontibaca salina]MBI6630171.1 glutathione S-transferase [Pontibaca salina]